MNADNTPDEEVKRALNHMVKILNKQSRGKHPKTMMCGPWFLLNMARRFGQTGTDAEILDRYADCLNEDGVYVLKTSDP